MQFFDIFNTVCWKSAWCLTVMYILWSAKKVFKNQSENEIEMIFMRQENTISIQDDEVSMTGVPWLAAAFSNIDPDSVGPLLKLTNQKYVDPSTLVWQSCWAYVGCIHVCWQNLNIYYTRIIFVKVIFPNNFLEKINQN